ncbi:GntR family transcriptional regulator [Streptomyces sp. NPDC054797]
MGWEFGVARSTVRRALRSLEGVGAIVAIPGVGRQVATMGRVARYEERGGP